MYSCGYSPRGDHVVRKAEILLSERVKDTSYTLGTIGKNWVTRYIKRHIELCSAYSRRYTYQRAKCEDLVLVAEWFKLVHNVRAKYGIEARDIYNFDETGFQMGASGSFKVITGAERRQRPKNKEPGNREWVTAVETIVINRTSLPPLIIFPGKVH